MKMKVLFLIIGLVLFSSCSILNQSTNLEIPTSTYQKKEKQTVYAENSNDTVKIYFKEYGQTEFSKSNPQKYPKESNTRHPDSPSLYKNSIDIDFLTIPFKYRPKQKDVPNQFTTSMNGAIYFGKRLDAYKVVYTKNPLNQYQRCIKHYAFSLGIFTGLGATTMNPSVTEEKITKEYDGLVWSKGLAGIIGVNNFTVGIAVGFDDLLDENREKWIYQQKMWYGLAFGLNLN